MRFLFSVIAITLCALTADAQTFLGNLRQSEPGKGKVTVSQSADIDALVNGTPQQEKKTATTQSNPQQQVKSQQTTTKEPVHTQLVAPNKTKTQEATPQDHKTTTKDHKTTSQDHKTTPKQESSTMQHVASPSSTKTQQAEKPATKQQEEKPVTREREDVPAQKERVTSPKEADEETTTVVDTRKKVMSRSYKTQGYRIQVFSGGNSRKDRQKAENAGTKMKSYFPNEPIYVHFYSPSWKCRMGNYKSANEARSILAKVKKLGYPQACIVKGPISVQY